MHVQHFPVSQDMAHGITVAVFTANEWSTLRIAVNRVATGPEPTDDAAHVFWRQCQMLAGQMHG